MIERLGNLGAANPVAFWLALAACAYFSVMAVRLAVIDVRHHLLPDRIVFPSYAIAGLLLLGGQAIGGSADAGLFGVPGLRVLAGGAALWLFYFLLHTVYPPGMGFGDVKLAGVLGMYLGFLGWGHVLAGTIAAFILGGLWSVGLLAARRGTLQSAIPFGPFMLAGTAAAMLLIPAA
ncbi:prepilin peptidase [Arthrobacter sp. NPDC058192]|uniref:prepilin peptidase n=1 Tax=Arthrobacter sp. NPDC058192 TaxID=3346372 RepID=UPI0036E46F23